MRDSEHIDDESKGGVANLDGKKAKVKEESAE
jgi:hypothetical protein